MKLRNAHPRLNSIRKCEHGAAAVEFALVLPILIVILLGILDFGLYYYNDLQLTHVARDAARYLSVGKDDAVNVAEANDAIDNASLVSTDITTRTLDPSTRGNEATVTLEAVYHCLTPLPRIVGIDQDIGINATAKMRRE